MSRRARNRRFARRWKATSAVRSPRRTGLAVAERDLLAMPGHGDGVLPRLHARRVEQPAWLRSSKLMCTRGSRAPEPPNCSARRDCVSGAGSAAAPIRLICALARSRCWRPPWAKADCGVQCGLSQAARTFPVGESASVVVAGRVVGALVAAGFAPCFGSGRGPRQRAPPGPVDSVPGRLFTTP